MWTVSIQLVGVMSVCGYMVCLVCVWWIVRVSHVSVGTVYSGVRVCVWACVMSVDGYMVCLVCVWWVSGAGGVWVSYVDVETMYSGLWAALDMFIV